MALLIQGMALAMEVLAPTVDMEGTEGVDLMDDMVMDRGTAAVMDQDMDQDTDQDTEDTDRGMVDMEAEGIMALEAQVSMAVRCLHSFQEVPSCRMWRNPSTHLEDSRSSCI